MKWSIGVDEDLGAIVVTLKGRWDLGVGLEALEAMWSEQAARRIHRVIWDGRELLAGHAPSLEVREVANRQLGDRPDLPKARAAMVAGRDLEFGMGRMMEAFLAEAPVEFRTFRAMEDARAWISETPEP